MKQSYEAFAIGEPTEAPYAEYIYEGKVDEWKADYIEFAESYLHEYDDYSYRFENARYALVDIDENGIPEMFIYSGSGAGGSTFITYNDSGIERLDYGNSSFISYIEGENIFDYSGGHMDNYYDDIYEIKNGGFALIARGDFGAVDNSNVVWDEAGYPVYKYYWNDIEVSRSEYQSCLNSVFDESRKSEIQITYTYNQIINTIYDYK